MQSYKSLTARLAQISCSNPIDAVYIPRGGVFLAGVESHRGEEKIPSTGQLMLSKK